MMEASHFDANEAYAAVDRHRLTDNEPHVYRTRDGGKSWQHITRGLPAGVYMQTVKEDPVRRGLLFAGTELGVFVSFNDGDDWQSLQLNLPPVSVRDIAIKGHDLIVATHGRGSGRSTTSPRSGRPRRRSRRARRSCSSRPTP